MTILSSVIVASDAAPCACTASPILAAAKLLLPTLERCERIDARHLRAALEVAFGATNTSGVWDWKTAYEACEVTTGMVRARFGKALLSEAATRATRLEYLGKITKLLSNLSSRGRTIIDLAEGLQLRRARVMRAHRIELTDFTEAMCERLRAYGLFAEIIPCKLRFFLPIDASWLTILAKLFDSSPVVRIVEREAA